MTLKEKRLEELKNKQPYYESHRKAVNNPLLNALTFTGAATGSYDGSTPVTIDIPSGGGGTTEDILLKKTLSVTSKVNAIEENLSGNAFDYKALKIIVAIKRNGESVQSGGFAVFADKLKLTTKLVPYPPKTHLTQTHVFYSYVDLLHPVAKDSSTNYYRTDSFEMELGYKGSFAEQGFFAFNTNLGTANKFKLVNGFENMNIDITVIGIK